MVDTSRLREEFEQVARVLDTTEPINRDLSVPTGEFLERQLVTCTALESAGAQVGIVFSDQHYNGDVPYLGGNTNSANFPTTADAYQSTPGESGDGFVFRFAPVY